jgi:hypothetical protein
VTLDPDRAVGYLILGLVLGLVSYPLLRQWKKLYGEDRESALDLMMRLTGPGFQALSLMILAIIFIVVGLICAYMPVK